MKVGLLEIPDSLLDAIKTQKVVVFAGAGVSMGSPANLPDFPKLVRTIAKGISIDAEVNEPPDRFLGRLASRKIKVHDLAAKELSRA
jgi:hypothetical protein